MANFFSVVLSRRQQDGRQRGADVWDFFLALLTCVLKMGLLFGLTSKTEEGVSIWLFDEGRCDGFRWGSVAVLKVGVVSGAFIDKFIFQRAQHQPKPLFGQASLGPVFLGPATVNKSFSF